MECRHWERPRSDVLLGYFCQCHGEILGGEEEGLGPGKAGIKEPENSLSNGTAWPCPDREKSQTPFPSFPRDPFAAEKQKEVSFRALCPEPRLVLTSFSLAALKPLLIQGRENLLQDFLKKQEGPS